MDWLPCNRESGNNKGCHTSSLRSLASLLPLLLLNPLLLSIGVNLHTDVRANDLANTQADIELTDEPISVRCSPQSEIYELSTRHLPDRFCTIREDLPPFQVNAWTGNCWERSTLHAALGQVDAPLPDKPTIVYVHGNFMERNNTLERVRIIDAYLKRNAREDYRLLLFSWPSQRESRPIRDVYENAESAEDQALYLAWILRQLRSQSRVSILAFSFGARTATGALHLDAGGSIPSLSMSQPDSPRLFPYRVGLIAPAIDKTWLDDCGRHQLALSQVSHFINMYNSKDPVLRRFRFIDRLTRPIAGGFAGFEGLTDATSTFNVTGTPTSNGGQGLLVKQYDCSRAIGSTHSEKSYLGECPYFQIMIDTLLWNTDDLGQRICDTVSR
ncbi:Alpha/beta hydrolase family protein [Pirellula sp. SH-Sr6A]|uniref:alpha/beta fold hydrolase n=1 Tax=Pirellula sp. SH-Sr6A TaxID=1632865 RepID=UPI00078C3FE0|nr:alpha/beta hydrolase [Pirellula sp. SH-Sr6A]AMV31467.1 Alpha/beta hydrolase family protein [Pirellula sp. SH-Sr6A]